MELLNHTLLVFIFVYGISFGVRNMIMKLSAACCLKKIKQSNDGIVLDAMFITGILYFITFGRSFIVGLLEKTT